MLVVLTQKHNFGQVRCPSYQTKKVAVAGSAKSTSEGSSWCRRRNDLMMVPLSRCCRFIFF